MRDNQITSRGSSAASATRKTTNQMKYIDRLLQGAPVEWLPLSEVFEMRNGYTPSKSNPAYWEGGTIPWFRMEDLRTSGRILEDSIQHITPEALKGKGLFKAGSILMATTATIGEHALLIADSLANQQFTNFAIRESLMGVVTPMFAYYYFFLICEWCKRNVYESSFPSVDMKRLREVRFPIPPVAVQEEVVRILDKFTALEAELEVVLSTELDCRKRQYQYYRDALLTFDLSPSDGLCHSPLFPAPFAVEWCPLGEVAEIYGGLTGKNKDDFNGGDALYIPYKNIFDNICVSSSHLEPVVVAPTEKQNEVKYGDLLFTASSETPEEVGMSSAVTSHFETPVYLNSFCFGVRFNEDVTLIPEFSKFLFRSTQIRRQISRTASGVIRFNVSKSRFKKLEIPIPPLAVQERIVEILDKFDTLVNSISEGLPREIELRRKQYEYYRDALLSF